MSDTLLKHKKILLYGCGGGYDIFGGVPLYLHLREQGVEVHLANYTFTDDIYTYTDLEYAVVTKQTVPTKKNNVYFPELQLAKQLDVCVYTFRLLPPEQLANGLRKILDSLNFTDDDAIICIDAGHDVVLTGRETLIGSPLEDSSSMLAMQQLTVNIYLACISAPTESMDFSMFLDDYKSVGLFQVPIKSEWKATEIFSKLLENIEPEARSIPSECLLAAMRMLDAINAIDTINAKQHCQQRLLHRIPDIEDFPNILPETAIYYFIDYEQNMGSPYYKKLLELFPKSGSMTDLNRSIYETLQLLKNKNN